MNSIMVQQGNYSQFHQQHSPPQLQEMSSPGQCVNFQGTLSLPGQQQYEHYTPTSSELQDFQGIYSPSSQCSSTDLMSPSGSPVRQLKRLHPGATNTATELLRCRRRIDLMAQLGYSSNIPSGRQHVNSVARRNERERNRVRLVNHGFALLRQHVPTLAGKAKKLSKVDTLRAAVDYIQQLKEILEDSSSEDGSVDHNSLSPSSTDSGRQSPHSVSSDSSHTLVSQDHTSLDETEDNFEMDFVSWFS